MAMKSMFGKGSIPSELQGLDQGALDKASKTFESSNALPGLGGGFSLPPGLSGFGKKNKSSYFRGNVSGKIIDSKTGEGLEYANISITNAKWNKVIEGTISGQNGKFSMTGGLIGEYILKINYN